MTLQTIRLPLIIILSVFFITTPCFGQQSDTSNNEDSSENTEATVPIVDAGPPRHTVVDQPVSFEINTSHLPPETTIEEILWDFGDGTKTTGNAVKNTYSGPGSFLVTVTITTSLGTSSDTTEVHIYEHSAILVTDNSVSKEQAELLRQQAAKEDLLLIVLQAQGSGPEVLVEEELTKQLLDIRTHINNAHSIILWTSGGVGANVLTKFSQHTRLAKSFPQNQLTLGNKGIILLSETPFTVLKPTAQSAFDQLRPNYIFLARPQILDLLLTATSAEEVESIILSSPLDYRLLGTFSARTVSDFKLTNFMSFGINFLVNRGVPINSIILILMLPVIATILAFARQVIGIKAFGLITPAMTTISFLVMGLRYGLIVFAAVLLAGTLTRLALRKLRLLYLPRMALVLTSVSLALLVLLGLGVANDRSSILSFSIFPALILTILAEEFIAAQFKGGLRSALTITAWTLVLATICYFIVSSEIFRTLVLSYPEIILLAIPINIGLGRWSGLRLFEYFRFRKLLRYAKNTPPTS
jgi:PKD repeat protein